MTKPYRVLVQTKDMPREEWLKWRALGIGGSEAAAIAGYSKYETEFTLWLKKTNKTPHETPENDFMYWGNVMEPVLAKEFETRTGLKVKRVNAVLQSIEHPFMLANLDRVVVGQNVGLEIKTASEYLKGQWEGDEVPTQYYLQCMHYLAVTGFDSWWIAVLIGGNKFHYKEIKRHEPTIQRLIEIERDFWHKVENNIMPDVDGQDSTSEYIREMFPNSNGDEIALGSDIEEMLQHRDVLCDQMKQLEKVITQYDNEIKLQMADNERARVGERLILWKNVTSNRLDTKRLKEEQLAIYTEFCKPSTSRRFEIK